MLAVLIHEFNTTEFRFNLTFQAGGMNEDALYLRGALLWMLGLDLNVAYPPRGYRIMHQMSQMANVLCTHL
jgi:hypothetical protein